MSVEDDAIAILAIVREQQATIDKATAAMVKATASLSGDYAKIIAAIAKVDDMPLTVAVAAKNAAESGAAAGAKNSLSGQTKALGGAIDAAVKRMREVRGPDVFDRVLYSFIAGFIGASVVVVPFWLAISFDKLPIKNYITFDPKVVAERIAEHLPANRRR